VIDRILGPQPGEIPAEIRIYIRVNKRFRARHVARLRKAYVAAKFYIVARRIARARHQRSDGGLAVPKCPVNARWPRLIGAHQLQRKVRIQLFSYCG